MKLKWMSLVCALVAAVVLLPALARAEVKDNAGIFSKSAVDDADRAMQKMKEVHNKEFVVETFAAIPDDQKDAYAQNPKGFFKDWMAARAKELKVNGVYALICMDPHHLEVAAGKNTIARGDFTQADVDRLYAQMKASLKAKDYDKALGDAVATVERAYTANISEPNGRSAYNQRETQYSGGGNRSYGGAPGSFPQSHGSSSGLGSIVCLAVGAVIIFCLIRSILHGNSGGGYSQSGGWGQQGYGGGGYGGGNYGGGGGGFGRGFLGGLLGGALGGYAADQFDHRNDQQGNPGGFDQGGNFGGQNDNSGGGGGGSFDSGPSDAGQGFGDSSAGGDFGSSGGGDSGGSSGGDF